MPFPTAFQVICSGVKRTKAFSSADPGDAANSAAVPMRKVKAVRTDVGFFIRVSAFYELYRQYRKPSALYRESCCWPNTARASRLQQILRQIRIGRLSFWRRRKAALPKASQRGEVK